MGEENTTPSERMGERVILIKSKPELEPKVNWKDKTLSIRLGTIVSLFLLVSLVLSGFFLGMFYSQPGSFDKIMLAPAAVHDALEGITKDEQQQNTTQDPPAPEQPATPAVEQTAQVQQPVEQPKVEPVAQTHLTPPPPKPQYGISTTYENTELRIISVIHEWPADKDYGKITHIKYGLKNGEEGIIEPESALIFIDGYEHPYKYKMPISEKTVSPGNELPGDISKVVTYSPKVIDPKNVKITLYIYDKKNKEIGSAVYTGNLGKV